MFSDFEEKYAPKTLNDIAFHSRQSREKLIFCISGMIGFPAAGKNGLLLHGINGTGKTALAEILPRLIELDRGGSGDADVKLNRVSVGGENGAKIIEQIKAEAILTTYSGRYRYFILDEVDNLTPQSMKSLKVAMNENSKGTIFILTTNNMSAIDRGVIDRCVTVEFNAAPNTAWLPIVKRILADNNIHDISDEQLLKIIECGKGSARDILYYTRTLVLKRYLRMEDQQLLAA